MPEMCARYLSAACAMVACSAPVAPSSGVSSDVVALITIDTWRHDHFDAVHTPNLWALAQSGERYDNAWSPIGLTTAAHASMLTGQLPWEHGVEANNHHGYALPSTVPSLPQLLPGRRSGAFVSAFPAGPEGGLDRGWDVFDGPASGERACGVAVGKALEWLPEAGASLLWVHIYEPHGPYEGDAATDRERYGQEVQRADACLAPLLARLTDVGARIVVAADHGEVLDEETCGWQHERSSSAHVLRVPLMRWAPDVSATVYSEPVGLTDVPALLAGAAPSRRRFWLGESAICEPGCTPGCAPTGLLGRDRVAVGSAGRWVDRPGRGRFAEGNPDPAWLDALGEIPPVQLPDGQPNAAELKALGYTEK